MFWVVRIDQTCVLKHLRINGWNILPSAHCMIVTRSSRLGNINSVPMKFISFVRLITGLKALISTTSCIFGTVVYYSRKQYHRKWGYFWKWNAPNYTPAYVHEHGESKMIGVQSLSQRANARIGGDLFLPPAGWNLRESTTTAISGFCVVIG